MAGSLAFLDRTVLFRRFRLVKQAVYLGIVISYNNMLDATMTSRIKSGQTAHRRLRKWLRGNHWQSPPDNPTENASLDLMCVQHCTVLST